MWAMRAVEGVEAMAGITVRTAMETPTSPALETLLLCLSGTPDVAHIRARIMVGIAPGGTAAMGLKYPNGV